MVGPRHHHVFVEFNSYEEAMKNSEDPVVNRYAAKLGELLDGPPSFRILDVISVQGVR